MTEAVESVGAGAGVVGLAVARALALSGRSPFRCLIYPVPEGIESPGLTVSLALADHVGAMLDTPAESAFALGAVQS
jgi:L-2-hydroxyglutarate oxidase LhgO